MKLSGTGQRGQTNADPFGSLLRKPYKQTVGAGIGVSRREPGFRGKDATNGLSALAAESPNSAAVAPPARGKKEKDRNFANQALGETPPRDGPFAASSVGVAQNYPTGAIKKKSSVDRARRNRVNPLAFTEPTS